MDFKSILDSLPVGVLSVSPDFVVEFANIEVARLTGFQVPTQIVGLRLDYILHLENSEGIVVRDNDNCVFDALKKNHAFSSRDYLVVANQTNTHTPVDIKCIASKSAKSSRVLVMQDITDDLSERIGDKNFMNVASQKIKDPLVNIVKYLNVALNPDMGVMEPRIKQYVAAAEVTAKNLNKLCADLLITSELDKTVPEANIVAFEIISFARQIAENYVRNFSHRQINYQLCINDSSEPLYIMADPELLRSIIENLLSNAIHATPDGGEIWMDARADSSGILLNVTDSGNGIAEEELSRIFEKFYRIKDARGDGYKGAGLGLFLTKKRTEAMGGKVWGESAFGTGSTFYVSLPRYKG